MKTTNRRNFLGGAAAVTAVAAVPAKAQQTEPTKRVLYKDGKKPAKTSRYNSTVAYGNLVFIAGGGYQKEGEKKLPPKGVRDSIKGQLKGVGWWKKRSLKVNFYLNDQKH